MLETLHIQNFALIDDVQAEFRGGFNVLTGETGAGKSIIVGALNLILGARASSEAVRDGSDRARIDAVFRVEKPSRRLSALLKEREIALEDGALFLSRTISADGRSRAYAGGAPVPISLLAEIGDELVDLHGQHDHQSLLKTDRQLDLLDAFGGLEAQADAVAGFVDALREAERELEELASDDRERTRRLEFLRHEVGEIDGAQLEPGEEEEARARRGVITNAEQIAESASAAYAALSEGDSGSALDSVAAALNALESIADVDPRFTEMTRRLDSLRSELEDVSSEVLAFTQDVEYDPEELERLNARIAQIGNLKRKYGESVEAILAYRDKAAAEIDRHDQRDHYLEETRAKRDKLAAQAEDAAHRLSDKRGGVARKLDKQASQALQELGMKGGRFEVHIEQGDLHRSGFDRVAFLLTANPGEKPKPLRNVASGGEISRVMLAIKTVFAGADTIPTLVFDEIDAGVGGAVAKKVAERLRLLAASHQTLCITHIAQIASVAQRHLNVEKSTRNGRTTTRVRPVEGDERVAELARLLDGSVSDVSLTHAKALLGEG